VQCLGDGHCPSDKTPQCVDHECSACTDNDACADHDVKLLCDKDASSSTKGQCVQCTENRDCENPTPQCTAHQCVSCTSSAACKGLTETPACNTRQNVETSGQCVECTAANETMKCGNKACDRHLGTCTGKSRGSVSLCEPCVADSECVDDAKCVMQKLGTKELGRHCFWVNTEGKNCSVDQPAFRPYATLATLRSVDGSEDEDYCQPVTTCSAILSANGSCSPSAQCGEEGVDDGVCLGGGTCSYPCQHTYECPLNGNNECDTSLCQ
jgi:hypothetical protein